MVDFSRTESEVALGIARERPVCLKFGDCTRDSNAVFELRPSLECKLAKLFAHIVVKTARIRSSRGFPFCRVRAGRRGRLAPVQSYDAFALFLMPVGARTWNSPSPVTQDVGVFLVERKLHVIQPEPLEYLHPFVVPIFCHLQPFSPVHRGSRKGYRKRGFFAGKDTTQVKYYVGA